jgi:hypothetical protein
VVIRLGPQHSAHNLRPRELVWYLDWESNYGYSLHRRSRLSRSSWLDAQGLGFNDVSRSHNIEISHVYNSIYLYVESAQCWPPVFLFRSIRCHSRTQVEILRSNEYVLEPTLRRHTRKACHRACYLWDRRHQSLALFQQACQDRSCYSSSQCYSPTLHDSDHRRSRTSLEACDPKTLSKERDCSPRACRA